MPANLSRILNDIALLRGIAGPRQPVMELPVAQMMTMAERQPEPEPEPTARPAVLRQGHFSAPLAGAFEQAGYTVLNEYIRPTPWSTGGHLHVQWPKVEDRQRVAAHLKRLAAEIGYDINIGGWGTGPPHRGRAHKERRALDITIRRRG